VYSTERDGSKTPKVGFVNGRVLTTVHSVLPDSGARASPSPGAPSCGPSLYSPTSTARSGMNAGLAADDGPEVLGKGRAVGRAQLLEADGEDILNLEHALGADLNVRHADA
jgi:hypothetical protein